MDWGKSIAPPHTLQARAGKLSVLGLVVKGFAGPETAAQFCHYSAEASRQHVNR